MNALAAQIAERIHREGPVPFDAFVAAALYGDGGFFRAGRGAGRAGRDFVTSPEVGGLFGALVARAADGWWRAQGEPDPFLLVDAGAGRGRLAADLLAADPDCARALRLVLVERSETLREEQRALLAIEPAEDALGPSVHAVEDDDVVARPVGGMGPIVTALAGLPAVAVDGAVVVNELLDNLPFRVVELAADGWLEVRIGVGEDDAAGSFVEVLVPAAVDLASEASVVAGTTVVPVGVRLPVPTGVREWLHECAGALAHGVLAVVDYAASADELVDRGVDGWLRTFRGHERGMSPLTAVGDQDITIDLPLEYVVHAAAQAGFHHDRTLTQAEWLRELGVDELLDEARRAWDARAHVGDLEALRHRSRVSEASALLDPAGLGAHQVLLFSK
jgi:SAM-dependent MidA family methyltransferase